MHPIFNRRTVAVACAGLLTLGCSATDDSDPQPQPTPGPNPTQAQFAADDFEPNESLAGATTLALDGSDELSLHTLTDVDYLRVAIDAAGMLAVVTAPTEGTLRLDVAVLTERGDALGAGSNGRLEVEVEAGEYFLRVRDAGAGVGRYLLETQYTPAPVVDPVEPPALLADAFEPNDAEAEAAAIALDSNLAPNFHVAGDVDFYAFDVVAAGRLVAEVGSELSYELRLSTALGEALGNVTGETLEATLEPGRYLLRVSARGEEIGTYRLVTAFTATPMPEPPTYPADDFEPNDHAAGAATLVLPADASLTLHDAGDLDYFTVGIEEAGTLALSLVPGEGAPALDVALLDADGRLVAATDPTLQDHAIEARVEAGSYLLRARGFRGSAGAYALTGGFSADPPAPSFAPDSHEPNDSLLAATALEDRQSDVLTLHSTTDVDYLRFAHERAMTLSARITPSTPELALEVAWLTRTGEVITTGVAAGEALELIIEVPAGAHYLRVRGLLGTTGRYRSIFRATPLGPAPDVNEPNDKRADATRVSAPHVQGGLSIDDAEDRDFFRYDFPGVGSFTAQIQFAHAEGDLELQLQDARGERVAEAETSDDNERLVFAVMPGTYFLVVSGFRGATANYLMQTAYEPLTDPGDRLEPNNDPAAATAATLPYDVGELSIHEDDVDVFAIELDAEGILEVALRFEHADGNLEVELRDLTGALIARAASVTDNEELRAVLDAGRYFVHVRGAAAETNDYAIEISRRDPPPPGSDINEPNNSRSEGTPINLPHAQNDLSVSPAADVDYFRIELTEATSLVATIRFSNASGDLDMEFQDANGQVLGSSTSTSDQEVIRLGAVQPGTYFVFVYGFRNATNDYDIAIETVEAIPLSLLFSDLVVSGLGEPEVFVVGNDQQLGLVSRILNVGTAPAPGGEVGNGTATFRLKDTNGNVIAEGVKGPVLFSNNGGCPGADMNASWVAAGSPRIPGSEASPGTTDPGCVDLYTASVNANLHPPILIGDPALVPDGDYIYELEVDAVRDYIYEPAWVKDNNIGRIAIRITGAGGVRTVTVNGPLEQEGVSTADSGTMTTTHGNGAALAGVLPETFNNDVGIERVWGANYDANGNFFFTLWDDGSLCRDNGDGTSTRVVTGLSLPMVFDFLPSGEVFIADYGANQVLRAAPDGDGYGTPVLEDFPGFTIVSPAAVAIGDHDGRLYVVNSGGHEILAKDLITGDIERVAGTGVQGFDSDDGPADSEPLSFPIDIDFTAGGVMIIADGHNNRIRAVNLSDAPGAPPVLSGIELPAGQLVTLAGAGETSVAGGFFQNETDEFGGDRQHARASRMDWPFSPRIHDGRIYYVDADNHRLRVIDRLGYTHTIAGNTALPQNNGLRPFGSAGGGIGDGGRGIDADLNRPMDLRVIDAGNGQVDLVIADTDAYRIRRLNGVEITGD